MNLNQFLIKIFELFPPKPNEDASKLLAHYIENIQTGKNYDFEKAFKDFITTYEYRTLPPIAKITNHLKAYVIKNNDIEYRDIVAWKNQTKYSFAYNPKEQSYEEVKRDLVNQGLRVFDSEQKEYV